MGPDIQSKCHSRYDPEREAESFVSAMLKNKHPSLVFIVGGGLNYITCVVKKRCPRAFIISLQPCGVFEGREVCTANANWNPDSPIPLALFIRNSVLPEYLGGGAVILDWAPLSSQFPEMRAAIMQAIQTELNTASSDAATRSFWARRWLINCIRFALSLRLSARIQRGTDTISIACAGPSLNDDMSACASNQGSLWSTAQAFQALQYYGVRCDMVITSDAGFWNHEHLRTLYTVSPSIPLAAPPSAYIPAQIFDSVPIIALDTGLSFERAALDALDIEKTSAAASGSVSGTAISLALAHTSGNVLVRGYDAAARSLDDHVRPYAFDVLDEQQSYRLSPLFSRRSHIIFERYPLRLDAAWRTNRAFALYASQIGSTTKEDFTRLVYVSPSPVERPILSAGAGTIDSHIQKKTCIQTSKKLSDKKPKILTRMFETLSNDALTNARTAIENGKPLSDSCRLFFEALAPKQSAMFLARAARGQAAWDEAERAFKTAFQAINSLKAAYHES